MIIKKKSLTLRRKRKNARSAILISAQKLFAEKSYDRTTIRDIAAATGIDPALVIHYFGTKQELFVTTMMPLSTIPKLLPEVLEGDRKQLGARFAKLMGQIFINKETSQFLTAVVRAAASEPKAAAIVKGFIGPHLINPTVNSLSRKKAKLYASLIGAQVIGIIMMKYIVKAEPLASASPKEIETILVPLIQKYFE